MSAAVAAGVVYVARGVDRFRKSASLMLFYETPAVFPCVRFRILTNSVLLYETKSSNKMCIRDSRKSDQIMQIYETAAPNFRRAFRKSK